MVDFNIEEILLEASYKSKKGYLDLSYNEDVKFLENIMYDMKYPSNFIEEYVDDLKYENMKRQIYKLDPSNLDEGILDSIKKFISTSWQKLKSIISISFKKASDVLSYDDKFEQEYTIVVPRQLLEHIDAANLILEASKKFDAMKGYYNEALVCQIIWEYTGDKNVVNIDKKKHKEHKDEIDKTVSIYKNLIKDKNILLQAEIGSEAMSNYLINSAKSDGVVIVDIFLSGMEKSVGEKKDISIIVKRGMSAEEIRNYSLKLYSNLELNLSNMTLTSLLYNLTNPSGVPEKRGRNKNEYSEKAKKMQDKLYAKNNKYKKAWDNADKLNTDMKELKKSLESNHPKVQLLRDKRGFYRNILNPAHAEMAFNVLKSFIKDGKNKKIFVRNLLQSIGFTNSDTRMLLAVMSKKGDNIVVKQLVDEHPEFDLSDINLTKPSGITIRINNRDELIIKLNFKEGEQEHVSGQVQFSKVTPVPPDFWQGLI